MIDRAFQIIVVFMAAATSSEAEGEKFAAAAPSDDTSSIIFEAKTISGARLTTSDPDSSSPSGPLGGSKEISTGKAFDGSTITSGHIASMIAAGLPKYDPSPKATDVVPARMNVEGKPAPAAPGITSLPAFIVRESQIPAEDQILTPKGKAKIVMAKYLGPSDGFDRGVLNRYTLKQLWIKIPILRLFPVEFVGTPVRMSDEDRAYDAGGANDTIPYPHPPPKTKDGSDE